MKETLRVRPVIVDVARLVTADVELGAWRVRAGTIVVPAIALVQLMPEVYPDPYEFRPERFLDGQPAPYTWIPFGGGVRRCLGARLRAARDPDGAADRGRTRARCARPTQLRSAPACAT